MNTSIPIDTNLYQFASSYAQQHKMSVRSLVETYLSSLRNTFDVAGKPTQQGVSNVLSFDELHSELQEILTMSAPMKGQIPEWDLEGDIARKEVMKTL